MTLLQRPKTAGYPDNNLPANPALKNSDGAASSRRRSRHGAA